MNFDEFWAVHEKNLKEIVREAYDSGYEECDRDNKLEKRDQEEDDLENWEQYRTENGLPEYKGKYKEFAVKMIAAGYEVKNYSGKFFYSGPAVECEREDLDKVIQCANPVNVQWDSMGLGFIVYVR